MDMKEQDAVLKELQHVMSDESASEVSRIVSELVANVVRELSGELLRLRQCHWEMRQQAGFDNDGDKTPEALVSDFAALMRNDWEEMIKQYKELADKLHNLEVAANTVVYCYTKRPENFASALKELEEAAAAARSKEPVNETGSSSSN